MKEKHFTMINETELCGVSVGNVDGKKFLVLATRMDPESFEVFNLGLSIEDAVRLHRDLGNLFQTSKILKQALKENEDGYPVFQQIMFDEPVSK